MVKIIPWADRKLTKKNLAKIWNLFPNDEICMIDIPTEYYKLQWAKVIARYYILRGKDFSIEIDPIKRMEVTEQFLDLGCRKFYFIWGGMCKEQFYSSMDALSYSINIVERFPDSQIYIIYEPPYYKTYSPPDEDWLETSITFLSYSLLEQPNIKGIIRRPHPWFGKKRTRILEQLEEFARQSQNIEVENPCGCFVVNSNTNIYCCPFCQKRRRKKLFGNADRDKFVCGTIDRGLFRHINCDKCNIIRR